MIPKLFIFLVLAALALSATASPIAFFGLAGVSALWLLVALVDWFTSPLVDLFGHSRSKHSDRQ